MTRRYTGLLLLMCATLFLSACAQKTPDEVAAAFWEAAIENDASGVVKYSTLGDVGDYDGFGRDWSGYRVSWGKIVIDGDEATVATTLTKTTSAGDDTLSIDTVLIRQEERWKVDYARTAREVKGGPLGRLFGEIERMGKSLSEQLDATSSEVSRELDRIGQQLGELSATVGEQASDIIEKHGKALRKSIEELAESARRALEEQQQRLSDSDRQRLREVANELDEESEQLAEPTLKTIADSSKSVAVAQQKLGALDNDALAPYQQQWQAWGKQFEAELQQMLDEVSRQEKQE